MKIAVLGGWMWQNEIEKIFNSETEILFYLDNNTDRWGIPINGKMTYSPYNMPPEQIDYLVVMLFRYDAVLQQLEECGIDRDKIILFFDSSVDLSAYHIFSQACVEFRMQKQIEDLQKRLEKQQLIIQAMNEHILFEMADCLKNKDIILPNICSVEETCEKIISDHVSMSRYGDGEFQVIFGHAVDVYQGDNAELARRLAEILTSDLENHIVALADDYGAMEGLSEFNKNVIRKYMTNQKRQEHYRIINLKKKYYNAYISRPYVIYPHEKRKEAETRFANLKQIWNDQKVVLVEGNETRMGVGNDLFDNARSVSRVLAPNNNAFDVYDDLLERLLQEEKDQLFLVALGPTATVLAYDMAKEGYWVLDIGHLDLEYEWYLKGKGYSYIPNKYNNEVMGDICVSEVEDDEYYRSIKYRVGI